MNVAYCQHNLLRPFEFNDYLRASEYTNSQ